MRTIECGSPLAGAGASGHVRVHIRSDTSFSLPDHRLAVQIGDAIHHPLLPLRSRRMIHRSHSTAGANRFMRWGCVFLAILPFQLPLLQHFILSGAEATGFLSYDAPYYAANGREIFERGNGFAYPNPYDSDPATPVIYFHWLVWLLGFGV